MKKYLLTSLLGLFAFAGFASADTVGNFSSESSITSISTSNDCFFDINTNYDDNSNYYIFKSYELSPAYGGNCGGTYIESYAQAYFCFQGDSSYDIVLNYNDFEITSTYGNITCGNFIDEDSNIEISPVVNGVMYISQSPIAYTSGSDGDNSGGSLLPNGESDLSGIITGLNSTIIEFIPYLVYLGLGIITVIIGFVAIRWLVNRTQAKIRGTFSSGRRRK